MVTRIREKGQVTIPVDIRQALHLGRDSVLSVVKVGDGVLLTPKFSVFESTSAKFAKAAQEKGITLEGLLKDLKKIRHKDS
jgi:AbrB family looped-hinge helix DNA binding protein